MELAAQTLTYNASIALGASTKTITKTGIAGVKKDDSLIVISPSTLADGYAVVGATATADGTIAYKVMHPSLAINGTFSIVVRTLVLKSGT